MNTLTHRIEEASYTEGRARAAERFPVIYLLDVNVLLAIAYPHHIHNRRVFSWLNTRHSSPADVHMYATCAITELGFVRIASGGARLATDIESARRDLVRVKDCGRFVFLGDNRTAEHLPDWVTKSDQTTDGHLLDLAASYGARLVTLDRGIPGADLVSELSAGTLIIRDPGSGQRLIDPDTSNALVDPPLKEIRSSEWIAGLRNGVTPQP
jgi:predicted nucleic acid-binding protein